MLERIAFERFRILRDVDVELEPFTVVVGANSSGKTTFLSCLEKLAGLLDHNSNVMDFLFGDIAPPIQLRITGTENLLFNKTDEPPFGPQSLLLEKAQAAFGNRKSLFLQLSPQKLQKPSYSADITPTLRPDGTSLASVLADLKFSANPAYEQILHGLKAVVPSFQNLEVHKVSLKVDDDGRHGAVPLVGYKLLFDMSGEPHLPAEQISTGTLITLGLLTALQTSQEPSLVLWDDMESGLHPLAMEELIRQIRTIQERQPDLQIVATSHSPYMVGHFKPAEVRLTALRKDGTATIGKLTDHPDFERWDGYMDAGEFWSAVGENWLTEDEPEPAEAEAVTA